jgi:hypothetical protein
MMEEVGGYRPVPPDEDQFVKKIDLHIKFLCQESSKWAT